jgi:hypothetical protein
MLSLSTLPLLQLHAVHGLLLCIVASCLGPAAAAGCDPVVTSCPSALAAAQALTGNNPQLTVTNAAFSGACGGGIEGMLLITDFGCHYLATQMPLGECNSQQQDTCSCCCTLHLNCASRCTWRMSTAALYHAEWCSLSQQLLLLC